MTPLLFTVIASTPVQNTNHSASYTLKVPHATVAADAIVEQCQQLGGFMAHRQEPHSLVLRVPTPKLTELRQFIEEQGVVLTRHENVHDISSEVARLQTKAASLQKLIGRYFKMLNESPNQNGTLSVQRELNSLVEQLERQRGRLRYLKNLEDMARVTIGFQLKQRQQAPGAAASPFPWLNTMNLQALYQAFAQ